MADERLAIHHGNTQIKGPTQSFSFLLFNIKVVLQNIIVHL